MFTSRGMRRPAVLLVAAFAAETPPIAGRVLRSHARTIHQGRGDRSAHHRRSDQMANSMLRGMITPRMRLFSIARTTPAKPGDNQRQSQPRSFRSTSEFRLNRSGVRSFIPCLMSTVQTVHIEGVYTARGWTAGPGAQPISIFLT